MPAGRLSQVIGFDDAPFTRSHRGDVMVVGAVFARLRLEGVVSARVRRDGVNATPRLASLLQASRFRTQLHAVLLQGIAVAGFNVIDIHALHAAAGLPVIVVARRAPDPPAIRRALARLPGGARKWRLIERAGAMEPLAGLYVQRAGVTREAAEQLLRGLQQHSTLPEPLRVAHLIAGGVGAGESRHRA